MTLSTSIPASPSALHEWAGTNLPPLMASVHPVTMPLFLREQILDIVLAKEIDRLEGQKWDADLASVVHPDPKVQEVLENGGFDFQGYDRQGQQVWHYIRSSRDGRPLSGKEAKHPPTYKLTSWGDLACRCDCPYHVRPGQPDKHVTALTFVLMQTSPMQAAPNVTQSAPTVRGPQQDGPQGTGREKQ